MNSYNNLDPSLFHRHVAHPIPQYEEYPRQVHQEMIQNYSTFQQPPAAESVPRRHTEVAEQASRMLNALTDESNKSFYPTSPPRSASLSPSHLYPLRVPVSGKSLPLRHVATTQTEPKNSGNYLFPNPRPMLRIAQVRTPLTLTPDQVLNHPRRLRRFEGMEVTLQRVPPTPARLKLPLRLYQ
jgi:hypothetical protein